MTEGPLAASMTASRLVASTARQSTPPARAGGRCLESVRTAMPWPASRAARWTPTWPDPKMTWSGLSPMVFFPLGQRVEVRAVQVLFEHLEQLEHPREGGPKLGAVGAYLSLES